MTYQIKSLNSYQQQIDFEITADQMRLFLEEALTNLAQNLEINGYRKGKVPKEVAQNYLEPTKIWEEAAILAIKNAYNEVLEKEDLKVIDRPQITITKLAPQNDLTFRAIITVLPEITLPKNYKDWAKEILKREVNPEVTEEEIQEVLEWFKNLRTQLKELDRPAQKGDILEIDFETFCENIPIEGGSAKNHRFILGSNHFLAGFEDQLINASKGEVKKFSLRAPDDWPIARLRSKNLDFEVKIKMVAEKVSPEINDDFAKELGHFKNLEELKNKIKSDLFEAKKTKEEEKNKIEFLEKISQNIVWELPASLIEMETNKMIAELKDSLSHDGLDYETYLKSLNKDEAEIKAQYQPDAEKRIKYALILETLANDNKIMVSETEIEEALKAEAGDGDKISQIDTENLRAYIKDRLRYNKVFQLLANQ